MGKLIRKSRPADDNMPPGEHSNGNQGDRPFEDELERKGCGNLLSFLV